MTRSRGVSLVEITVAILIAAVISVPVLMLMTTSREETCKAVNYLRALEIAHETIEWINATPLNATTISELLNSEGSLIIANGANLDTVPYPVGNNAKWVDLKSIKYPEQYAKAYFFRKIEIEPVSEASVDYRDYLYKVVVTIFWNEGKVPPNLKDGDRQKKVVLSTLIADERRGY